MARSEKQNVSKNSGQLDRCFYIGKEVLLIAVTYLKAHHISKGETIEQSMKDRFNYGQNPNKTQGGSLILSYQCDPKTADAEFLLAKAKYKAITGREQKKDADVLCYQIRQAFPPGELDAEAALAVSYELAMRWTKGKHAFFVVSHIDRPHPHCHIYYNSTTLDCTRKFRDFLGSGRALRRLSDRVCIEHGLSVIANPKLHSQGQYKHYGAWLGGKKPPTFQQRLKAQIDLCLAEQPDSFAAFLQAMETAGFEAKQSRGAISFRAPAFGQERFTRLRDSTLGDGYTETAIRAVIEGRATSTGGRVPTPHKVDLIIDIEAKMRAGKGSAYRQWATVYNLKQMAAAVHYLREQGLTDYVVLERKTAEAADRFHALSEQIKTTEAALRRNTELRAAIVDYAKTRPIFEAYKAKKYSNAYLTEHEAEISLYRAAQSTFRRLLDGGKFPKMETLKTEGTVLSKTKKKAYTEYRAAREEMRELAAVKANIDRLFSLTDDRRSKEIEQKRNDTDKADRPR